MKLPGFKFRIAFAVSVIAASAAWLMRPLDRSVLIPVKFRGGPPIGISSDAGFINPQGREVFNQRWGSVGEFRGEAALVFRDLFSTGQTLDRHGHLTASGELPRLTSEFGPITTNDASDVPRIRGYADSQGRLKFPIAWDRLPAEIQLVPVRQGPLWGYMNRSNAWVLPPQFSEAGVFGRDELALVARDDKYGCINGQGVEVIQLRWGSLSTFDEDGQAVACADGACGVINRQDEIIIPVRWQSLSPTSISGTWNAQNGHWGIIDRLGNVIVPCDYDTVLPVFDGDIRCWKGLSTRTDERLDWWGQIRTWWLFGGPFPRLFSRSIVTTYPEAIYDSSGNLIWRNTWFFTSWASVWILLASAWIGLESVIWMIRRRHHKRPEAPPPSEPPDLSSAARTH